MTSLSLSPFQNKSCCLHIRPYGLVRGHLPSKDTIALYVNIHPSLWIKCHLPHLLSHTALLLLSSPPPCSPPSTRDLRSLTRSPPSVPSLEHLAGASLQSTHWSLGDTDRHLKGGVLCVSVSVQQQGSHCEIRLHAGANWTQGSLKRIVDHARYLAYLNVLIRSCVCCR